MQEKFIFIENLLSYTPHLQSLWLKAKLFTLVRVLAVGQTQGVYLCQTITPGSLC